MFEAIFISAAGVWIGIVSLIIFAGLIYSVETDSFTLGSGILIVGLLTLDLVLGVPIWEAIVANPLVIVVFIAAYVAAGSAYAYFWKVPEFLDKNSNRIKEDFKDWSKSHKSTDYDEFLNSSRYRYSIKSNIDRVATWVMLWPAGVAWELSHKPIRWIWNKTYYGIGELLESKNRSKARQILEDQK